MALGALEREILTRMYGLTQEMAQWVIHFTNESCGLYKDIDVIAPLQDGGTRNTEDDLRKMCSSRPVRRAKDRWLGVVTGDARALLGKGWH
jgi:hypothetical protein